MGYWIFRTRRGPFLVVPRRDGLFQLRFREDALGTYGHPAQAANDAGGGHHPCLDCFPDDGESLGVPKDLSEWTFVSQ